MDTKVTHKQYEAVLRGMPTMCSERLKERKTGDLEKELAKAQLQKTSKLCLRYSGAARSRHKSGFRRRLGKRLYKPVASRLM
jgi:hypothetical protein